MFDSDIYGLITDRDSLCICCISQTFNYSFHLLLTSSQEVSFYGVKGYLLEDKMICLGSWKDIFLNSNIVVSTRITRPMGIAYIY